MSDQTSAASFFGDMYPYRNRFPSNASFPKTGRDPEEVYKELLAMSGEEDQKWETGQCSGTMYHGGKPHYAFLDRVFSLFSYVNLLQRDLCPSGTKFEAEIAAKAFTTACTFTGNGRGKKRASPNPRWLSP
jgi:sphinganine-1-phosphate aldolase